MKRTLLLLSLLIFTQIASGDIVSYLRFEENGGSVAHDETGLLDGEFNSFMPTEPSGGDTGFRGWSTAVPLPVIPLTGAANNGSIRFAGGSEFIDLSNFNDLLLGTSFTIEMFIKPDDPINSVLFGFSPGASLGMMISMSLGDNYFNLNFMGQMPFAPATDLKIDQWQHLALVKEPGFFSIYLDGSLSVQEILGTSTVGPYNFPGVGTFGTRTIGTFRGYIDEFRISDEALTPDHFLIVPEPGTLGLLLLGAAALAGRIFSKG